MDLFSAHGNELRRRAAPLADRMRPRTLDEYIGQSHIIAPGRLLRRAIQIDQLTSVIFYGPPGTGKTTLARIIANTTKAEFLSINAVLAGVKEIRESIAEADRNLSLYGKRTILFVDEVHRFNKAQQDALLPHVENGTIVLIGATTENPYFEVNKALVSRSRIFQLKTLTEEELEAVARQAIADETRGFGMKAVRIPDDAMAHLVKVANGDARSVLNALELAVETTSPDESGIVLLTRAIVEESIQQKAVLYDKDGDAHYDTISAFIKSVRGSDPDAALYWMAKMLSAGEDPRFIFRRMVILAMEDVGLADPHAISVVMSCAQSFDFIGMPEGRYPLSQACLYLCTAPKSNTTMGFFDAIAAVQNQADGEVPDPLKDASRDKDGFGHGEGYLYPHAYRDHWVAQQYLPDTLQGRIFYEPSEQGYEKTIRDDVLRKREARIELMADSAESTEGEGDLFLRRTSGGADLLSEIRDAIFELCPLVDESLVLDLCARTGMLTFEALRSVRGATVWALCQDDRSFDTLSKMAARSTAMERPVILRHGLTDFRRGLCDEAGGAVLFDVVVARNAFPYVNDKAALVREAASLVSADGTAVFAESHHPQSQRLADLIQFADDAQWKRFASIEASIHADTQNTMVNWDPDAVALELHADPSFSVKVHKRVFVNPRHILPSDIDHWLRNSREGERRSLGDRLRDVFSGVEMKKIEQLMRRQLQYKDVQWKSAVVFFVIKKER